MIHFTEEPTLKDYLAACKRRAWVIAAVLVAALMAGASFAFFTEPQYRAEATVLVDTSTWNTRDYVERAEVPEVTRVVELLAANVLSHESLAELAHKNGLYPEIGGDAAKLGAAARKAASTEVTGFDQFQVRFVHPDKEKAAVMANALADAFVSEQKKLRELHGEKTTTVMNHELTKMTAKLSEQGEAIKEFRIKNQGSLPGQTEGNIRAIERWQGDLRLNTASLERAKQRLSLALASTPKIYQGDEIEVLRADVTGLEAERAQLGALIRVTETKVAKAAEVEGALASMQRDQDATLRTYNEMLDRQQAATLRVELDRTRFDSLFSIVEPATAPSMPFKPAPFLIIGIAFACGLLGGAALAIALDWFDESFHDAPALARVTGLPVLAALPKHRRLLGAPARP
jgi:succinoglycan biosynthesis transport protein ExoP